MESLEGKRLLFIGGGEESAPGIDRARLLGVRPLVLDRDEFSPGVVIADAHLRASIFDIGRAVKLAKAEHRNQPIDGVLSVATDAPRTVAAIAEELGLPGIGAAAAALVSDKFAMKRALLSRGIATAPGHLVSDAAEVAEALSHYGETVVLKPVDSRGARGVSIIDDQANIDQLFSEARSVSPSKTVLVERFLPGPQFSTESVIVDGRVTTVGISTRNYGRLRETRPYPVEDGGELLVDLEPGFARQVDDLILSAATALGIRRGTVKGDLVLSDGRLQIIELAGRLSGGYFATHEIPICSGVDLVRAAIELALGIDPAPSSLRPIRRVHVAQRYLFPRPGRVRSITVPDAVGRDPDLQLLVLRVKVGDVVPKIVNHPARAGLVIATGDSRDSAVRRAESAVAQIVIATEQS